MTKDEFSAAVRGLYEQAFLIDVEEWNQLVDELYVKVIDSVADSVRNADVEEVTPVTAYESGDSVDCFKAQTHAFILSLKD